MELCRIPSLLLAIALISSVAVGQEGNAKDIANLLDDCRAQNFTLEECRKWMESQADVQVVVVKKRSMEDDFYFQVVIPVDNQGLVLGVAPDFDGVVYYPFPWRGTGPEGTRSVGPWDCSNLSDAACCNIIMDSVSDPDVDGKHLDCWLEETFSTDPQTGDMIEVYRNINDGSINILNSARIARLEHREKAERWELIEETKDILSADKVHRDVLSRYHGRIRHALRGYSPAQDLPYEIKLALRTSDEHILIHSNMNLMNALAKTQFALRDLGNEGGLHRMGGLNVQGDQKDVIILEEAAGNEEGPVVSSGYLNVPRPVKL